MSAEIQMSAAATETAFPYKAMSSTAIASLVLAGLAALTGFFFWPALSLAALGIVVGVLAMDKIRRYPDEFDGRTLALAGVMFNGLVLLGGAAMHTYIYLTEVPEGYTRVQFYQLQQPEQGPDRPTDEALAIDGQPVFLKGYIHPSSGSGLLRHFVLVPDLGTCCFGGQPRSSDMIEVTLGGGQVTEAGFRKKKLAGTFQVKATAQKLSDFDNYLFYRMQVDQIK